MAPETSAGISKKPAPRKCKNMMYTQQIQHLPAKTKENLIKIVETKLNPKRYAVIIHDKEVDQNGQKKEPDIHVMLCFENARSLSRVAKVLGDKPQYIEKWDENANNGFAYLIHATKKAREEGKYQYDPSEVTANFDYAALVQEEIPAEMARAKGERSGRVKDLLDGLMAGVYTKEEVEQQLSGSQYGRYRRQIEYIWTKRLQNLAAQWRKEKREQGCQVKTIWIYGATGTGKTSFAKDYAKKVGQEYFVSGSSRDLFQDYSGEHTIILDELRPGVIPYSDFLRITDPWGLIDQVMAPSRYTDKGLACDLIIITSPYDPYQYYNELKTSDVDYYDQLLRRLSLVLEMTEDTINAVLACNTHFEPTGTSYVNIYSRKARPAATNTGADLLREMLGSNAQKVVESQVETKNPFDIVGVNYGNDEF